MATKKYISFSNLTSFLDNLKTLFATKTEMSAKANTSHTHTISDVANLQSTLNGKAASSHGTHVSYSSTAPLMDGTASVGTASTVARSDHKHPTDTSRAAQTSLDSHTSNSTTHITSTERTNWNAAYTHSQSAHAPSNAEANQNAFSNVKIGDVTIAADIKTDTLTLVAGSNITLTPDATNDKITISSKDTTYSLGSFGITATAAELNKLDGVTATATELNYMDGVTSNVQTQLDGKAASGHTHNYAGSSSVGGAATSANKLNTNAGSATQPVYFKDGVPVATSYKLEKSVPSSAVFTDSHYTSKNVVGATNATLNTSTALTNGNVYLNSVENGAVTSSHKISGSGATTVTTDANGNIVISSTDNNTTYSAAGSALGLVKSGGDVTISSGVITVNDDSHNHTIANVDNLQSSLDAKSNTNHTHNYAGSSSAGGAATSANKVNKTLTIQLNSGTTEGTNKFTFDGSAAKSFNITPSSIGASTSGHSHDDKYYTETEIDGKVSTLNTAINGKASSSHTHTIANITNLQTTLDGKSSTSHTHKYAGSASAGGSATSAVKLDTSTAGDANTPVYFTGGKPVACTSLDLNTTGSAAKLTTARTIGLGNDLTGSATFDGSGNVTISAKHYNVTVSSGNKSNYPYHRFAYRGSKASPVTSQYSDTDAIFLIRETYNTGGYGILKVSLRTNSSTSVSQASATWLVRYNLSLDDVKIGLYNVFGSTYADIFIKTGTYARTTVIQLEGNRSWTLVSSNEVSDTTTTDAKTSTECYVSIEAAATTLHGQAYSSIISSVDGGQVATAAKLGSSTVGGTAKPVYLNSGTATACSSTVGSATQPVYMNGGTITACTYTLGKSVPSNAVFTDTDTKVTNTLATTTKAYVTGTTSASTNTGTQVFDTGVYLDTTAGQLTATTFNGTTFKGSGVATLAEVKTYLGI